MGGAKATASPLRHFNDKLCLQLYLREPVKEAYGIPQAYFWTVSSSKHTHTINEMVTDFNNFIFIIIEDYLNKLWLKCVDF